MWACRPLSPEAYLCQVCVQNRNFCVQEILVWKLRLHLNSFFRSLTATSILAIRPPRKKTGVVFNDAMTGYLYKSHLLTVCSPPSVAGYPFCPKTHLPQRLSRIIIYEGKLIAVKVFEWIKFVKLFLH